MTVIDVMIPILAFLAVLAIGSGIAMAVASRHKAIEPRLGAPAAVAVETGQRSLALRLAAAAGRILTLGGVSGNLKEQLTRAGFYHESAATTYLGIKLIILLIGVAGTAVLLVVTDLSMFVKCYLVCLVAATAFFLPNLFLRMLRQNRSRAIRNHLPDAIDLLEICVSAGMGLDMAWNAVCDEIRRVSADEMALVNLEVQLGASRTVAMRNMADRTGADELTSLVALLIQSDRFGTSIAEALRTFAASMRETRSSRAEEAAEKMAVKLLFPLVFFIFPVMLIVMVGPAGMTLYRVLGSG